MLLHSLNFKLYLNKISKEMLGQTIAEQIKPLKLWSKYAIKKWLGLFRYVTTTWSWDCREAFPYKPSLHYCLYSCTVTPVGFWISLDFGVMIFILIASILQIMNFKIQMLAGKRLNICILNTRCSPISTALVSKLHNRDSFIFFSNHTIWFSCPKCKYFEGFYRSTINPNIWISRASGCLVVTSSTKTKWSYRPRCFSLILDTSRVGPKTRQKTHTISAQSVLRARTHRNLRSRTKFPETSALEFLHLLAFSIIISWILSGNNYLTDFLLQKKHVRITHNFAAHTNIDNVTMTDNCGKKTCHFLVCYFVLTKKIIHFWKRFVFTAR